MLGMVFYFGYTQIGPYLKLSTVSLETILGQLTWQAEQEFIAGGGGSNFNATPVGDPSWLPMGLLTVLFRPFPWEAGSALVLFQSMESILLAALVAIRIRPLLGNIMFAAKNPLIVYAIVFVGLNIIVLSTLGNFGLLSRQRVLIFPFIFILVAATWAVNRRVDEGHLSTLQAVGV